MQSSKGNKNRMRLKYFNCLEGGQHEGQVLNYVCVKKDCHKRGLLCSICILNHKNHKIIPLKLLLSELKSHNETPLESSQGFQNQLEQIENLHKIMLYELRTCVETLANKFMKVEEHINEQFAKAKIQLLERVQMNMRFNSFIDEAINNKILERQNFLEDMKRISGVINIDQDTNKVEVESNLKDVVNGLSVLQTQISKKLKKIQNIVEKQDFFIKFSIEKNEKKEQNKNNSKKDQQIPKDNNLFKYSFDVKKKSSTIVLSNNNLEARQSKTNQGRFAFIEQGKGIVNQKIVFEIMKMSNWIGVGIALQNKICAKQYLFEYSSIGHGSYLISSNGYSWSHSDLSDNIKVVPFKFVLGDIIEVEYCENVLKFFNRKTSTSASLNIKLTEDEKKQACFCVNLCSEGDKIKILSDYK